jgi:hypothetical protein
MERPNEIWWCRQIFGGTKISGLRPPDPDCQHLNGNCCTDHKPCDAIKGKLEWEEKK